MAKFQSSVLQHGVSAHQVQREELVDSARAEKENVICIILTTKSGHRTSRKPGPVSLNAKIRLHNKIMQKADMKHLCINIIYPLKSTTDNFRTQ